MITGDINDLIYIAERQSDERLAQELNPETETGMLGPPWLSASELAYRQKIRSEAQAEPSTAPSIVQQLAQTSLPQLSQNNISSVPSAPIGMPQQPMPQQPMPQQPMPQQPMPQQQAMPTQMMYSGGLVGGLSSELMDFQNTNVWSKFPSSSGLGLMSQAYEDESLMGLLPMLYKQSQSEKEKEEEKENSIPMMAAGGLLNYANGGIVNDPYAFNLQSPSFAPFPMDAIAPMPKEEFEAQYGLGTLDYDPADSLRFSPPPLEGTYQKLLPHIEEKIMGRATETVPEEYSPFRYGVTTTAKELLGYGTAEESQREIDARKINLGLRDALREIEVEGSAGFGDITGYFRGSKKDHKKITEAEDFFEGLMPHAPPTGASFLQSTVGGEADTLTISRFFANNPDEYAKLNYLTEKFGPKRGLVQYSQANKGLIDRLNKGAEEVAEFYGTKDA